MNLIQLQDACRDRVEECFQIAEKYYGVKLRRVPIVFSNRMKKTAGSAHYQLRSNRVHTTEIQFANTILERNPQEFLDDTPGHEAAHIISMQIWGKGGMGHGYKWKEVMGVIGQRCFRYHTMETAPTTKSKNYIYRASCGTVVTLKRGRHAKVQRGITYHVTRTGGKISRQHFIREEAA